MIRAVALVVGLAVAMASAGAPLCAPATHHHAADHHQSQPAPDTGCPLHGGCPAVTAVLPAAGVLAAPAFARAAAPAAEPAHRSFISTPLPPPPLG